MPTTYLIYFAFLLFANASCLSQIRQLATADKMIAYLLALTMVEELISFFVSKLFGNNFPVYHAYSPLELLLISLYFYYCLRLLRKRRIGIFVAISGLIIAVINVLAFQKLTDINSYFLLFEGAVIILLCLISFYQIMVEERHSPFRFAQFWISLLLILYWGATFTGWGLYTFIIFDRNFVLNEVFGRVVKVSNYIFYFGLALVFLRYRRLIPSGNYA